MSTGTKRPIAQVLQTVEELHKLLAPSCHKFEVAGSIRRRISAIGDIELVAIPKIEAVTGVDAADLFSPRTTTQVNRLWETLDVVAGRTYTKCGPLYRQFQFKDSAGEWVKVDLFTARQETWGLIFAIRTGPWEFSKHLVTQLVSRGYRSIDGQVIRLSDSKPISTPTEQDVFDLAGIPNREPYQRG